MKKEKKKRRSSFKAQNRIIALITALVMTIPVTLSMTYAHEENVDPEAIDPSVVQEEQIETVEVSLDLGNSQLQHGEKTYDGNKMDAPKGKSLKFSIIPDKGFVVEDVSAGGTDLHSDEGEYLIEEANVTEGLSIKVTTAEAPPEDDSSNTDPITTGGSVDISGSSQGMSALEEKTSTAVTGASNLKLTVETGDRNIPVGASQTVTMNTVVNGATVGIVAIPMEDNMTIDYLGSDSDIYSGVVTNTTINGVTGDFYVLVLTVESGESWGKRFSLTYTFDDGTTMTGTTKDLNGFIVDAKLSSGEGLFGSGFEIDSAGLSESSQPETPKKLTATTEETFSITKDLKTSAGNASTLEPRPYYNVETKTDDVLTVTYNINISSTGSGNATGRIYQKDIVIKDTISGFIDSDEGQPQAIRLMDGNTVISSISGTSIVRNGNEVTFDFNAKEALDANGKFTNTTYTIEVDFSKDAYTNKKNGSQVISAPSAIYNTTSATNTPLNGDDPQAEIGPADAATKYIGYDQEEPEIPSLTIEKDLFVSGESFVFDGKAQSKFPTTTSGEPVTFTLTPTSGSGSKIDTTIDANASTGKIDLTPGTIYTLTEAVGIKDFDTMPAVTVEVTNYDENGYAQVLINGDDYNGSTYKVTNSSSKVGIITADITAQKRNQVPHQFDPVADGTKVFLKDSNGNVIATESAIGGSVTFYNVAIGEGITYSLEGEEKDEYQTPIVTGVVASSTEVLNYDLQYIFSFGSFKMGKTFIGPNGANVSETYKIAFGLFKDEGGTEVQVGKTFTIDNFEMNTNPTKTINELYPAGEYYIKELAVTPAALADQYPLYTGKDAKVVITAGALGELPVGGGPLGADGVFKNTSIFGELMIKNFDYEANDITSGYSYKITNTSSNEERTVTDTELNTNGRIVNLPAGTYTVEAIPPTGSKGIAAFPSNKTITIDGGTPSDGTKLTCSIDEGKPSLVDTGSVQTVGFVHATLPTITAKKVQANSLTTTVKNVEFGLYKLIGGSYNFVKDVKSDSSTGIITTGYIEYGTYLLVEKAAPSGYLAPDYVTNKSFYDGKTWLNGVSKDTVNAAGLNPIVVSQDDYSKAGTTITASDIKNTRLASIKIKTVDSSSASNVSGAIYELYDNSGTLLGTASPTNGQIAFSGDAAKLAPGNYTIRQTIANGDYVKRNDEIQVTVAADGTITVTFDPDHGYANTSSAYNTVVNNTMEITFSNAKKPSIEMTKIAQTDIFDTSNNRLTETLPGVDFVVEASSGVYVVFDANKNMIGTSSAIDDTTIIKSDATGKININKLDPNVSSTYTVIEQGNPSVNGKDYTKANPVTVTLALNADGKTFSATGDATDNTILNTLDLFNISIDKRNVKSPTDPVEDSTGAPNAIFYLFKADDNGDIIDEANGPIDILTTGTGTLNSSNKGELSGLAISRPLPPGKYKLVEKVSGLGSVGVGSDNAKIYEANGSTWVEITGTDKDNLFFDFEITDADKDVILGNTAASGGGGEVYYVRAGGQKIGATIGADGKETLVGAINDVKFKVYLGYKDDTGEWHTAGQVKETITSGLTMVDGKPVYGYLLTKLYRMSDIKAVVALDSDFYNRTVAAYGFVLVEDDSTTPAGYDGGIRINVEIDETQMIPANNGQVFTFDAGNSTNANESDKIYNFAGKGVLTVNKFGETNTSKITGSVFKLYASDQDGNQGAFVKDLDTKNLTFITEQNLVAGYYVIKEVTASNGYNLYGKYDINGKNNTDFKTGDLIGPIAIPGNGSATVNVFDKKMPKLTIVNKFDNETLNKSVADATDALTPAIDLTLPLQDGTFTITETGLTGTSAGEFMPNAKASEGLTVTVSGGIITITDQAGTIISTTKTNGLSVNSGTGDITLTIDHDPKGALVIQKGYYNAIGEKKTTAINELTKAEFTVTPVGGGASQTMVWEKGKTAPKLLLGAGKYTVTEASVTSSDWFNVDTTPVYIEITETGIVYLQNDHAKKGASEATPLLAADTSKAKSFFYNYMNRGELQVNKLDEKGKALTGAKFALYQDGTEVLNPIPESGSRTGVYKANVTPGAYTVKEVEAPPLYDLLTDEFAITVLANKAATGNAVINVTDVPLTEITVKKVAQYPELKKADGSVAREATQSAVGGIEFDIFKYDGTNWTQVEEKTTETNKTAGAAEKLYGTAKFQGLGVGRYSITETVPSDMSYLKPNSDYSAEGSVIINVTHDKTNNVLVITPEGTAATRDYENGVITVDNPWNGEIFAAEKYDIDTGAPLSGAAFKLYSDEECTEENLLREAISDANGVAEFEPLEISDSSTKYYIKEVGAPSGYYLSSLYDELIKEVSKDDATTTDISENVAVFRDKSVVAGTLNTGISKTNDKTEMIATPLREGGFDAKYTLTQNAVNNPLPLAEYSVKDNGPSFIASGTVQSGDNVPKYEFKNVTVGAATAKANAAATAEPVFASVNGSEWKLLSSAQTFEVSEWETKTAPIEIKYSGTDPGKGQDPTEIGIEFVPAEITLNVTFKTHIQDPGTTDAPKTLINEIDTIRNNATISGVTQNEKGDNVNINVTSNNSDISVATDVRPTMSISKGLVNSSLKSVKPSENIEYTVTLTNNGANDIKDPIITDLMDASEMYKVNYPTGAEYKETLPAGTGLVLNSYAEKDGGSSLVWKYTGTLKAGESINITYMAHVLDVVDGTTVSNKAYGTSGDVLSYSSKYPDGASFTGSPKVSRADKDLYAKLNDVTFDKTREGGLYVSASAPTLNIGRAGAIKTLKSVKLESEESWNSNNSVPTEVYSGNTLMYRLRVANDTVAGGDAIEELVVTDYLPIAGDARGSAWGLGTGILDDDSIENSITVLVANKAIDPSKYDAVVNNGELTVTFKDFKLEASEVLDIIISLTIDSEENLDWDEIAYTIAKNDFNLAFFYEGHDIDAPKTDMDSNIASARINPQPIKIKGYVWNDVNRDGIMDDDETFIEGATVNLISSDASLNKEYITIEDGFYKFSNLPASYNGGPTYKIQVTNELTSEAWMFSDGTAWTSDDDVNTWISHIIDMTAMTSTTPLTGNTGVNMLSIVDTAKINAGMYHAVYNVTYHAGDSKTYPVDAASMPTPNPKEEEAGASHNIASAPTRPGFVFDGWEVITGGAVGMESAYMPTGEPSTNPSFTMPYNDVELVATWTIAEVDLHFAGSINEYDGAKHGTKLLANDTLVAGDEITYYAPVLPSTNVNPSYGDPSDPDNWVNPTEDSDWYVVYNETVGENGKYTSDIEEWVNVKTYVSSPLEIKPSTPVKVIVTRDGQSLEVKCDPIAADDINDIVKVIITPKPYKVITGGGTKEYDGSALTNPSGVIDGLVNREEATVTATTSITDVLRDPSDDPKGNVVGIENDQYSINWISADATNYQLTERNLGILTITPKKLTVYSSTGFKDYDGSALVGAEVTDKAEFTGYRVDGLVDPEEVIVNVTGEVTYVDEGEVENTAVIDWNNPGTTAKEGNYETEYILGKLLVAEAEGQVVVVTTGETVTYDGQPHGATVEVFNVPVGYTVQTAISNDSSTNVTAPEGIVADCDELVIVNTTERDVTEDLKPVYINGTIVVNPVPIEIITESATKMFDGSPLTAGGEVTGFIEGESADFEVTGRRIEVGSSENTYDMNWNATTLEENYYIANEQVGTLNIFSEGINILENPNDPSQIGDNATPRDTLSSIGDMTLPLGAGNAWALLNLMLAIATNLIMIALLVTYFFGRPRDGKEEDEERREREEEIEGTEKIKRRLAIRIFSIVTAVVAIVAFILTEDITQPMQWVDRYTIWMAIIAAVQVAIAFLSMKKYYMDESEEDDDEDEAPETV